MHVDTPLIESEPLSRILRSRVWLKLDCLQVVVEHNKAIIPRQRLDETHLHDGDTLEVIHFVGGG